MKIKFPTSNKQAKTPDNQETVKQFLARGGKITQHGDGETGYQVSYFGLLDSQRVSNKRV